MIKFEYIFEYILNRFFIPFNFLLMFFFKRCLSSVVTMTFDLETLKSNEEYFEINFYHLEKLNTSNHYKIISVKTLLKYKL